MHSQTKLSKRLSFTLAFMFLFLLLHGPPAAANNAIMLVANHRLFAQVNAPAVITAAVLEINDGISPPADLIFTLVQPPAAGSLRMDGQELRENDTFSQADIHEKRLEYWNESGAAGADAFSFTFGSASAPAVERVSLGTGGTQANRAAYDADMSADGRYVAFTTRATNLSPQDPQDYDQIYVYDRALSETIHVSAAPDGLPGKGYSRLPVLSAAGDWIAYSSNALNLSAAPRPAGSSEEVYLYDRAKKQTEMIWVDPSSATPNWITFSPSISADGQVMAVWSAGYQFESVWVYRRASGAFDCASWNAAAQTCGHGALPVISRDGRWTAFLSGDALLPQDQNHTPDVYLYDVDQNALLLVSRTPTGIAGSQAALDNRPPSISADGRFVAYASLAPDLVAGDRNAAPDFFVFDRLTGQNELVSVSDAGEQTGAEVGTDWVEISAISGDGRYVAFYSVSGSLDGPDDNGSVDLFVRDRQEKTTRRVLLPRQPGASRALYDKQTVKISDDGTLLLFTSAAGWLVSGDTNGAADVFVAHTGQMASVQIEVRTGWFAYLPRLRR